MFHNCTGQRSSGRFWAGRRQLAAVPLIAFALTARVEAQFTFSSGSTGADGQLNVTTPGMTYFDPTTIPNHKAGDTIFNFTTINIASGSTLRLDSRNLPGPVYWLATGDVTIAGTVDLNGTAGASGLTNRIQRVYSVPGAGGFSGGPGSAPNASAEDGAGPGRGAAGTCNGSLSAGNGVFSGNQYLIPLVGGSGGGGLCANGIISPGGGAGGGAVLIASSTSITVSGAITAQGGGAASGPSAWSGAGSGGAIRLIANSINVMSYEGVNVSGGSSAGFPVGSSSGFSRLESYHLTLADQFSILGNYATSTPFQVALPVNGPATVLVTTVNGIPVNSTHFTFPDVTITSSQPVPVVIQGQNVPPGAVPTLYILSENTPDQVVTAPALQGTFANSTSTVNITYPPGGSTGIIRLTWTN